MAINPMQAPIDYLGQMGIRPTDPGTALLEGLQLGAVFKQQRQEREKAVKAEEFNTAASDFYRNPTLEGARNLQANFPEYAAQFNDATKDLTAEQRMNEAKTGAQVLSAIRAGKMDVARNMLGQLSQAAREQGDESGVWDQFADFADEDAPTAYAYGLATLAAAYPAEMKVIGESWKDLGVGGGKPGIKDVDRQPTGLSIITYEDGTQEVKDVYGNVLTGEAAAKAVEAAENRKMQMTEAGVQKPPGGVPEQAFDRDQIKTFFDDVKGLGGQLRNIQRARNASKNAIVGTGADARLEWARLAALLFPNNKNVKAALQDTRNLVNASAEAALKSRNLITGDGQGPATEGEQKLLNDYVGGRTEFSPAEWEILLNVIESNVRLNAQDSEYLIRFSAESGNEQAKKYVEALQGLPSAQATRTNAPAAGDAKPPTPTNVEVRY
jgi:hypothetical protein